MDINGYSDPYCIVYLDGIIVKKTAVVSVTLNPIWNEEMCLYELLLELLPNLLTIISYVDGSNRLIQFEIWDHDHASSDDFMGYCEYSLDSLNPFVYQNNDVSLQNKPNKQNKKAKKRGTFYFEIQYLPFQLLTNSIRQIDPLLGLIINSAINDQLASSILTLFYKNKEVLTSIYKEALTQEVNKTSNSEQLFRTDSMCTKLMKNGSKIFGLEWLKQTLKGPTELISNHNQSVEVDPSKAAPGDNINHNIAVLKTSVQSFMSAILDSLLYAPELIKLISHEIWNAVNLKFPDKKIQALGSFIFLRFFCPAISSPEQYGLCNNLTEASRRHFLLIAKIIQSIVNHAPFISKDPYLSEFNPIVEEMQSIISKSFETFINAGTNGNISDNFKLDLDTLITNYTFIADYLTSDKFVEEAHSVLGSEYRDNFIPVAEAFDRALKLYQLNIASSKKSKKSK